MTTFTIVHGRICDIRIQIYTTRRAMNRGMQRANSKLWPNGNARAGCLSFHDRSSTLFFNQQDMKQGTISHEFCHALYWAYKEKGWTAYSINPKQQERFATSLADVVNAFYERTNGVK
jgi:hypothetical protein